MSNITVRVTHYPTHTPVMELQVAPTITLLALRLLIENHFASEAHCMMRVFHRWFSEVMAGGRKRLIEITNEDSDLSLASMGIKDYGEVHVEGPVTDGYEGVGQAVGSLSSQIRQEGSQTTIRLESIQRHCQETNVLLRGIASGVATLVAFHSASAQIGHLQNEAYLDYCALRKEEDSLFNHFLEQIEAAKAYAALCWAGLP